MKLTAVEAEDLLYIMEGEMMGDFHCLRNVITQQLRWGVIHEVIFKYIPDKRYYRASFQKPATELQSIDPWFERDWVECTEVEPVQRMVTIFEVKK